MKVGKVFTEKQWRKYRAKQQEKIDRLTGEATDEGFRIGTENAEEKAHRELASVLFNILAREPGQVHCEYELDKGSLELASMTRKVVNGKVKYEVYLRSVEPL